MTSNNIELSVVSPVFNEEEIVQMFFERVTKILDEQNVQYEVIFVDDGSRDRTFQLLRECKAKKPDRVKVIALARNFGHQLAITAGLRVAQGQAVVVMDSDLQDPPEIIPEFMKRWREGYEIVYGSRTERKGETWFKRATASLFYKMMKVAANIDIPENVGDFYLLDKKVVATLNGMEEQHRFIRGLLAWVGYKRIGVGYVREARSAGQTKFGFWRMLKFSFDAVTSFSFFPLRGISFVGSFISMVALLSILIIIYMRLFTDATVIGWSSLMAVVLFIGGIQLLAIGVIGEYVARIGDDVKSRPLYTIREVLD